MKKNKDKPLYIKQSFLPKFDKIRKLLAEKYPNCFVDEGGQPKPLKIGIIDEIYDALNVSAPDLISRRSLKFFLSIYTSSSEYINAMVQDGAMRIGLDGANVEPVSDKNREDAKNDPRKVKIIAPKKNIPPKQNSKQNSEIKQDENVAPIPEQSPDINKEPKRKVLSLKKKEG